MSTQNLRETDDLLDDPRWQLVQRIAASPPFRKSARVRELLLYIAERAIHGHLHELTEQQIGDKLFHKPSDYSPLEDSSVRVHARQLRLKLHEYFDEEGRNESMFLTIPKGSYAPAFRVAAKPAPVQEAPPAPTLASPNWRTPAIVSGVLCILLTATCGFLLLRLNRHDAPAAVIAAASQTPPWPYSQVFDARHQSIFVVADSNYGMYRILTRQAGSLDGYLRRGFLQNANLLKHGMADTRLNEYISNSTLTSFADVADVVSLLSMAGPLSRQVSVRYPRELGMRDLDHQNFIFIGSPASDPWVSLFQNKLNFREAEIVVGSGEKAFINSSPLPGEQARYEGLGQTGATGEDYATIALLPNVTHDGSVLVLQGLQQEGTEAAGRFLTDPENRRQLANALGVSLNPKEPAENIWFEALIRSRTAAGASNSATLVAVRRIH